MSLRFLLNIGFVAAFGLVLFQSLGGEPPSPATRMLSDAVDQRDLARARRALSEGADVNRADGIGSTVLHTAAWKGDLEMAELLIEHGAWVNRADTHSGATPLHSAARGGSDAMMHLLLDAGANPNATTYADLEQCDGRVYPAGVTAADIVGNRAGQR